MPNPGNPTPSELIAQLRGVVIGDPLPASLLGEQEPTGREAPTAAPTESALARLKNLLSPAAKPTAPQRKPDDSSRPTPMGDINVPAKEAKPQITPPEEDTPAPLPDDIKTLSEATGEIRGTRHLEALFERVESLLGGKADPTKGSSPKLPRRLKRPV